MLLPLLNICMHTLDRLPTQCGEGAVASWRRARHEASKRLPASNRSTAGTHQLFD
jgi:hypothetical protein